mmetsp:Transcript_10046/g.28153  ORF Transcript_10046/g.28153 Transcript_10046/m.28153 type:complete len:143 (-) Transcript_10046:71-499(-)
MEDTPAMQKRERCKKLRESVANFCATMVRGSPGLSEPTRERGGREAHHNVDLVAYDLRSQEGNDTRVAGVRDGAEHRELTYDTRQEPIIPSSVGAAKIHAAQDHGFAPLSHQDAPRHRAPRPSLCNLTAMDDPPHKAQAWSR